MGIRYIENERRIAPFTTLQDLVEQIIIDDLVIKTVSVFEKIKEHKADLENLKRTRLQLEEKYKIELIEVNKIQQENAELMAEIAITGQDIQRKDQIIEELQREINGMLIMKVYKMFCDFLELMKAVFAASLALAGRIQPLKAISVV